MDASTTGTATTSHPRTDRAKGYLVTGRATLALIALQFGLAGLGAFRGLSGRDTEDSWWEPHTMVGYGIALLTLVLIVLARVGQLGRWVVQWTAVTAALAVIAQPALASLGDKASVWFGLLHALSGTAIAAVLGIITARVARHGER